MLVTSKPTDPTKKRLSMSGVVAAPMCMTLSVAVANDLSSAIWLGKVASNMQLVVSA